MKYKSLLIVLGLSAGLVGCEKEFLQMPLSSTTTIDSVFSTTIKAQGAVANAYRTNLSQGLPAFNNWDAMVQENLSGSMNYGFGWTLAKNIVLNGLAAANMNEDMQGYASNFPPIRQAYLVKENIDQVADMSAGDKSVIKAEMQMLVAYRYTQMMIIYGGVPIVSKAFSANEDPSVPRNSVRAVLDSVVKWCDEAIPVLPSRWSDAWTGRMTKAAAMSIKAKALIYAARPLFNTASPYLAFPGHEDLICLGTHDASLWDAAMKAAEAVITEAETNGGHHILNTGNPLDDYGNATSLPANAEVLLAFKFINGTLFDSGNWNNLPMNAFYNSRVWEAQGNVLTTNHLENYYKADGTDQDWPATAATAFSDYTTRMNQMEARFKVTFQPWQMDAWSNPGDANWNNQATFGNGPGYGVARVVKFYYKASNRAWFEFPLFRLASAYLIAAEAYNEMGQPQKALERLNVIHERAGLPAITETDQAALRTIIQREWAAEFFHEQYRLHDVKHWKLSNIGNGIIGGEIRAFAFNDNTSVKLTGNSNYQDKVLYTAFWSPKMYLNPFPQTEVNKGNLLQNPGY
ncbi:MAG: RagB/SusD family nutrient uptake outer membrane protein [Candidatus Pseudobacter hemicellulosilyticus]|uniref:RagB/SusD family nutrient uptake outer membrane protein n=1 Tax=Candidatus Pseudobacter hemicellulosilyticus TaxID=3121375 RepID=A0AAJ6BE37_9BACT|nr:MAG: RagB/SusD family nutrient uptake outer membrane protein [Pseudobacter sp.]